MQTLRRSAGAPALLLSGLLLLAAGASAADRSRAVRAEFMRTNPCPSTGATRGPCPGWQVDHWAPLCIGGADAAPNLRWLTIEQHKAKTRQDVRLCRARPSPAEWVSIFINTLLTR